jgi:hypothetical protein
MLRSALVAIFFAFFNPVLSGQERVIDTEDTSSLIFTYMGPVASCGIQSIRYTDWIRTHHRTEKMSASCITGGLMFGLYGPRFSTDFTMQYQNNMKISPRHEVMASLTLRGLLSLGSRFIIAPGAGLYIGFPPVKGYHGGVGMHLPLAFIFNTTASSKLFIEGFFRYGWFEKGVNSRKISYGLQCAFLYKVGII